MELYYKSIEYAIGLVEGIFLGLILATIWFLGKGVKKALNLKK